MRKTFLTALAVLAASACVPQPRPAAAPAPADSVRRWLLRPVPTTPGYRQALEKGTRSPTGAPGERYWQQAVRYRIEAELDPATAELRGREWITYHNRSPETLTTVVLNLYQNVFTETARRNRVIPAATGGVTLERVAAQGVELAAVAAGRVGVAAPRAQPDAGYEVAGTLARLVLPRPLAPGDSAVLEVSWRHRVPPAGTFRTAWEEALGGRAFNVAQWYPQVAVFDDVRGWDATPYLGDGEFYLEYGDFDVSITLPHGWLVGATGTLQNPEEVLSEQTRARLARALADTGTVRVVTEADRAAGTALAGAPGGWRTWRFTAERVRDFAFAASDRYLWDAAAARVPDGSGGERAVAVHAFYRPGAQHWEQAARFGQHAVDFFSDRLIPYLYPQVTLAEGPIGGMEYPMLVFLPRTGEAEALYAVTAHEVGHEWFPMMVGQDEAAFAWMDEGITSFHEDEAREAFYPGTEAHRETLGAYLAVAGTDAEVPLMRHTDLVTPYGARGVAAYSKPAALLHALRGVLGDSVFDAGMRTYAREWLLKHPYPWDFFATMERAAGRELDWFFYPLWFETGVVDLAVASVEPGERSVRLVLRDLGDVPVPVEVAVVFADGSTLGLEIPHTVWTDPETRTATTTLPVPIGGTVARVELDPRRILPDRNRDNNVWVGTGAPGPARAGSAGEGR